MNRVLALCAHGHGPNSPDKPCPGERLSDGSYRNYCGDACSFVTRDAGAELQSRWQKEYEGLPAWVRKIVDSLHNYNGVALTYEDHLPTGKSSPTIKVHVSDREQLHELHEGISAARELAAALTAPFPPPGSASATIREFNVVELVAFNEAEENAFDQPCAFGHRVGGHAVYCHCALWPDHPRKCRRDQADPEYRHQDCPGYVLNPKEQK